MTAEIEEALAAMRGAWMAGRSAAPVAPSAWGSEQDEPTLAALAGQALLVLARPAPPADLRPRPPLPRLAVPLAPEALRPTIRRLLAQRRGEPDGAKPLIQFLAARGQAAHPADWMPRPADDWAGAIYAPWLAWAEGSARMHCIEPDEALTLETYAEWPWAERRAALLDLRRRDPAAARAIIAAKAPAEPAERRLRLVEILADNLGADDAPALETFAADRSDRVVALVQRLLARLGRGAADPSAAKELAAMLQLGRAGLLRRRSQLVVPALKSPAQEARRRELFGLVALADLAAALGAPELALCESAPQADASRALALVECAAATASEPARQALLASMLADAETPLSLVALLATRAPAAERNAALPTALARDTSPFLTDTMAFAGDALGGLPMRALEAAGVPRTLGQRVQAALADDAARPVIQLLGVTLGNLGLLADAAAAARLIATATAAGLSAADPRLDQLRLNAALPPSP